MNRRCRSPAGRQRGAGLAEFVVVAPTLLAMALATLQYGLVFHAKSNLNYASFEAARAGAVGHADPAGIRRALLRAMTPYYGGGRTAAELAGSAARATADLRQALRIEILSPTRESFDDYYSADAARAIGTSARVIPSTNLAHRSCPVDRPHCDNDPARNRSGQTLADANLLKLRVTYGIPPSKQVPLAGRFFNWAVQTMNPADADAFRAALLADGRIPLVSHVTLRMQSDAVENALVQSVPGRGNGGVAEDPGAAPESAPLPRCDPLQPLCIPAAGGGVGADTGPGGAQSDGDGQSGDDSGEPIC